MSLYDHVIEHSGSAHCPRSHSAQPSGSPWCAALLAVMLLVCFSHPCVGLEEVPLSREGGVYTLPVNINGVVTLPFILDSGAAEVNVPADVVLTLIRARAIRDEDFLPGGVYKLADGTMVRSPRFRIRSLKIGGQRISNVPASVGAPSGPLLLGQSLLGRLGTWSVDNRKGVLVLGDVTNRRQDVAHPKEPTPRTENARSCSSWQDAPATCAAGFVRAYYDDLNRRDVDAAAHKWRAPDITVLRRLIAASEWYKPERMWVLQNDDVLATVKVAVTTKVQGSAPTRWCGPIELIRLDGTWKILTTKGVQALKPSETCQAPDQDHLSTAKTVVPDSPTCGSWRNAAATCAAGFVRAYYDDLNRQDAEAAARKWRAPDVAVLRRLIASSEWYKPEQMWVLQSDDASATVKVDVTTKVKGSAPTRWCGPIALVRVDGDWKILTTRGVQVLQGAAVCTRE